MIDDGARRVRAWLRRVAGLFATARHDRELADELDNHIHLLTEDYIRRGLSPADARREAVLRFGGIEATKARYRDRRGLPFVETLWHDTRHAVRVLARNRGFAVTAILILALGIGVNTGIFTIFNRTVLRPVSVPDPETLVRLARVTSEGQSNTFSLPDYVNLSDGTQTLAHVIAFTSETIDEGPAFAFAPRDVAPARAAPLVLAPRDAAPQNAAPRNASVGATSGGGSGESAGGGGGVSRSGASGGGNGGGGAFGRRSGDDGRASASAAAGDVRTPPVRALFVSGNYLSALGGRAAIGRTLLPHDEDLVAAGDAGGDVAVLSDVCWQRRFDRDPAVIGRTITLNGQRLTIVGVMARSFTGLRLTPIDVWIPLALHGRVMHDPELARRRDTAWLEVAGRLAPGMTRSQAAAELTTIARATASAGMTTDLSDLRIDVSPGTRPINLRGGEQLFALLVMTATGLVLAIACANIAGVMLARAASRQQELSVRLSLGATRRRLLRQLITESLLLAGLGGAAGLLVAYWIAPIVLRLAVPSGNRDALPDFTPDVTVFAFSLLLSAVAGLLFGLLPAWQATRVDLTATLKGGLLLFGHSIKRTRLLNGLVAVQMALALVLLVSAALLVRSMVRVQAIDPGFETARLFSMELELTLEGRARATAPTLIAQAADEVRRVPGVRGVTIAQYAPLGASGGSSTWRGDQGRLLEIDTNAVSADFFEVLGIPLVRGRAFTRAEVESGAAVAIVTDALARRMWPGRDPIGQVLERFSRATVIGVTRDAHTANLTSPMPAIVYYPLRLAALGAGNSPDGHIFTSLVVTTHGRPLASLAAAERIVRRLDPRVAVDVETGEQGLERWTRPARLASILSASLGALALLLTLVGIYGVVAFAVGQRTHEIAMRMALGAARRDILRLVLRQALTPLAIGLTAGWLGLLVVTPLLRAQLHGLSPFDLPTFTLVTLAVLGATTCAIYLPARLAARLDPMTNLRRE